jgi:hypothetical protein
MTLMSGGLWYAALVRLKKDIVLTSMLVCVHSLRVAYIPDYRLASSKGYMLAAPRNYAINHKRVHLLLFNQLIRKPTEVIGHDCLLF